MYVLGIESSCDETGVAIVDGNGKLLAHELHSQIKTHAANGGVVPEIAARQHLTHLFPLITKCVEKSGLMLNDISAFAATSGPGLIGGVMVGVMAAKTLSLTQSKPFIGINHLEAHVLTPRMEAEIPFPYLVLLVSGGHSLLMIAHNLGDYEILGQSLDDAAGECFDKAAKLMGLGYPGGPAVEKMAAACADIEAAKQRFPFKRPLLGQKTLDFSFSGLKTAVRTHVEKLIAAGGGSEADKADLSASFQFIMAQSLAKRAEEACAIFNARYPDTAQRNFIVCGGVAANKVVRAAITRALEKQHFQFHAPSLSLCTDNGAMVAWAGMERFKLGLTSPLDLKPRPRWPLNEMLDEMKEKSDEP